MKKLLLISAFFFVLTSCGTGKDPLVGSWIQPIPGQEPAVQGVTLQEDGRAESINMATLLYDSWERSGDNLILKGTSVGNHQQIEFSDTLPIKKLSANILIIDRNGFEIKYTRRK